MPRSEVWVKHTAGTLSAAVLPAAGWGTPPPHKRGGRARRQRPWAAVLAAPSRDAPGTRSAHTTRCLPPQPRLLSVFTHTQEECELWETLACPCHLTVTVAVQIPAGERGFSRAWDRVHVCGLTQTVPREADQRSKSGCSSSGSPSKHGQTRPHKTARAGTGSTCGCGAAALRLLLELQIGFCGWPFSLSRNN